MATLLILSGGANSAATLIKLLTPTMDDPIRTDQTGWGPPVSLFHKTGPSFSQPLSMPVAQQTAWLARINPKYLLTYPTNLSALLDAYERGEAIPSRCASVTSSRNFRARREESSKSSSRWWVEAASLADAAAPD